MAVTSSVSNIVIEPVDALFGNQHMVCFDTQPGTSLGGDYILISNLTTDYYLWFNTGSSVDPAVSGRTGIEVAILTGDTAVQVAGKIAAHLNTNSATLGFNAVAKTNQAKVLIEIRGLGEPKSAFTVGTTTPAFVATIINAGSLLELGFIDSDVELAIEPQVFDITAHQTGGELLGQLIQSVTVGPITLTLKETQAEKLKEFLKVPGQEFTPTLGASPEAVVGVGALSGSKQFSNTFDSAKILVLHPTKKDPTDRDTDFAMWKAYPKINALTFSGEEDRKLEVEFSIYLDENRENKVSKMVYGEWYQNFLKA